MNINDDYSAPWLCYIAPYSSPPNAINSLCQGWKQQWFMARAFKLLPIWSVWPGMSSHFMLLSFIKEDAWLLDFMTPIRWGMFLGDWDWIEEKKGRGPPLQKPKKKIWFSIFSFISISWCVAQFSNFRELGLFIYLLFIILVNLSLPLEGSVSVELAWPSAIGSGTQASFTADLKTGRLCRSWVGR